MPRYQVKRLLGECVAGRNFVPRRRAGRMRQRNQIAAMSCTRDAKLPANYLLQSYAVHELGDRQSADGDNQTRPKHLNFVLHPGRAIANLIRRWNTICAAGVFTGETSTDGGKINFRANSGFIHSAESFEPAQKRFPRRVRERPFQSRLPRTGCLPNDHYFARYCAARNWRRLHTRAAPASEQSRDVTGQLSLFGLVHGRVSQEGHKGHRRHQKHLLRALCESL
jgi:hypothetical protein